MKYTKLSFFLITVLLVSCGAREAKRDVVSEKFSPDSPHQVKQKTDGGSIRFLGFSNVHRRSLNNNEMPPWKSVEIIPLHFYFRPKVGTLISVFPVRKELPHLTLAIKKIVKDEIDGTVRWEIELDKIKEREYFSIKAPSNRRRNYPSGVIAVYPAVKTLSFVSFRALKKQKLPRGVTLKHIVFAVDINGDGKADAMETRFCEDNPKMASCFEGTAFVLYRRGKKGWKKIHVAWPLS